MTKKKLPKPELYDAVLESIALYVFGQPEEHLAHFCDHGRRVLRVRAKVSTKENDREGAEKWHNLARQVDLLARTIRKNY